jgi:hypothetical protein
MRLETTLMAANIVQPDCFIYLEDEKRFFYVDDTEHDGNYCIFYFEEGVSKRGLDEFTLTFHRNKKLIIYDPYAN